MLRHSFSPVQHRLSCFDCVRRESEVTLLRHALGPLLVLTTLWVPLHMLSLVWVVRDLRHMLGSVRAVLVLHFVDLLWTLRGWHCKRFSTTLWWTHQRRSALTCPWLILKRRHILILCEISLTAQTYRSVLLIYWISALVPLIRCTLRLSRSWALCPLLRTGLWRILGSILPATSGIWWPTS